MEISEIKSLIQEVSSSKTLKQAQAKHIDSSELLSAKENKSSMNNWQKDILLDAISMLENNKQLDDSHPLDKSANIPIETFDEALSELSFIHTDTFANEAAAAQANLTGEDVLYLFTEEAY